MEKLSKLIPGFAENSDKPQALTEKIAEMNQKLERACQLAKSYGTDLRGIPQTVSTTVTTSFVTKGDYAAFMDGQGPRAIQTSYAQNANQLIITGKSFAGGKNNDGYEGLAWVNDGNGRELIQQKDGTLKMAKGRPSLIYVNRDDRIYTAEQTRRILNAYGFPAFASGKGRTAFETAKSNFDYRKRTSEVSDAEELAWWKNVLEQYAGDADAVKEANIEIYALTKKLREQEEKESQTANKNKIDGYKKQISSMLSDGEKWISREVKNNDMAVEEQIAGYRRLEEKYRGTLTEMLENTELTEVEKAELFEAYYEKRAELDDKILELQKKNAKELYDYQKELQDRYIDDRTYFGDWETDDPASAFGRVREGLDRVLAAGTITNEEYQKRLEEVGDALYEGRRKDSEQWLSDQKFYGNISEQEYIDGLERQKRYTQEYYDLGIISYRKYLEANRELDREIYSIRKELNEQAISDYYDAQKKELDIRRKAIEEKYALEEKLENREERGKKLSDLRAQLAKYEGAVTIEGKRKLQEIRDQIAEIEKQQRKEEREAEKQAELDAVDRQSEALETAKEAALKKAGELTNGMNSLMTIYSGRQYEIAQTGYQNICSLVDRSNAKLRELFDAERAARSYAGSAAVRYGDSYTLYQSNYNTIQDRTEADIFGRSAGRVFQNVSFRR